MTNVESLKCIFIISSDVSLGHALNCCSLLAANLGSQYPEFIGEAPVDADGFVHSGLCSLPITILKAKADEIKKIRIDVESKRDVQCYDVTTISQKARKYSDVIAWTKDAKFADLEYVGVALVGAKDNVKPYSEGLHLFR